MSPVPARRADAHAWTTPSCQRAVYVASSSRDVRHTGLLGGTDGGTDGGDSRTARSGCAQWDASRAAPAGLALAAALLLLHRRGRARAS